MPHPFEINPDQIGRFRSSLADWYALHARDLPWRRSEDPYQVWISEIMLQQTRVDQARPYFERFVHRFPDVHTLAAAEQDEVLLHWEGLGYYSRARNLHKAARRIVQEFGGAFPRDPIQARTLPGVGPYTASAVLSIAFGIPEATVDGNVTRVLARYMALESPVDKSVGRRRIRSLADRLVDPFEPGAFNQAMMDLGATVCTPTNPACSACPVSADCIAFERGTTASYPIVRKKPPVPHYHVAVGIVENAAEEVLLTKRPDDALLGGLWEFPGARCRKGESLHDAVRRGLADRFGLVVDPRDELVSVKHAFSHFKITMHAFACRLESGSKVNGDAPIHRWIDVGDAHTFALHRAARHVADYLVRTRSSSDEGTSQPDAVH